MEVVDMVTFHVCEGPKSLGGDLIQVISVGR